MKSNNQILRELRRRYGLTAPRLAQYMRARSVETVRNWLSADNAERYRPMPAAPLELLLIKLGNEYSSREERKWLREIVLENDKHGKSASGL
jgi:DNA-binding transcriptional regulator YiaG